MRLVLGTQSPVALLLWQIYITLWSTHTACCSMRGLTEVVFSLSAPVIDVILGAFVMCTAQVWADVNVVSFTYGRC